MDLLHPRCAGLDVSKRDAKVCVRLARLPRDPYVWRALAAGLLGSAATMAFLFATQTGLLSVVSVVASLYPAFTVLLAVLALHERIGRGQGFGLVLAGLAVALVTGG